MIGELQNQVNAFASGLDILANVLLKAFTVEYSLNSLFGLDTLDTVGITEGIIGVLWGLLSKGPFLIKLGRAIQGWLVVYVGARGSTSLGEFLENLITVGTPINLGDGHDSIVERAWKRASEAAVISALGLFDPEFVASRLIYHDIVKAVDNALSTNPNAIIGGIFYEDQAGNTLVVITADNQAIYEVSTSASVAALLDQVFDQFGDNYASEDSLKRGIREGLDAYWSHKSSMPHVPESVLEAVMNDPQVQQFLVCLAHGDIIEPSEITDVLKRFSSLVPSPVPTPPRKP